MKRDPRINARSMTARNYAIIFLTMLAFCGSYAGIYFAQYQKDREMLYIVLSMLTYIVVISFTVCVLFAFFRKRTLLRPVYRLCDAAQKVARGDFTVRLDPMRRDGKKDEFEVLFDDFNTMTAELASTELLKTDFLSTVSHEFKTPLTVIQNYATILQSEALTEEERREYSARIGEAARRLTVLVTNILQIDRLEHQNIAPAPEPFNLSEALSRCILNCDVLLEEKGLDLETCLDGDLIVHSDASLLDLVWSNLLANAIKFTPPGGKLRVEARRTAEGVLVSVADTGCGIGPEDLGRIFDRFYQADPSHATPGNGLGLALVKRVLDLLGGSIAVESAVGCGATFTVRLPR